MAVDNLPCELPRDASLDFGEDFTQNVLPHLAEGDPQQVVEGATIASKGALGARYSYLQDFVDGS